MNLERHGVAFTRYDESETPSQKKYSIYFPIPLTLTPLLPSLKNLHAERETL
jgi:hypothetical protein